MNYINVIILLLACLQLKLCPSHTHKHAYVNAAQKKNIFVIAEYYYRCGFSGAYW